MPEDERNCDCEDELNHCDDIHPLPFCKMDSKYIRNDDGKNDILHYYMFPNKYNFRR